MASKHPRWSRSLRVNQLNDDSLPDVVGHGRYLVRHRLPTRCPSDVDDVRLAVADCPEYLTLVIA